MTRNRQWIVLTLALILLAALVATVGAGVEPSQALVVKLRSLP
mgnify:CR=1 FL=1